MNFNVAYSLAADPELCDAAGVPRGSALAVVLAQLIRTVRELRVEHPERALPTGDHLTVIAEAKLLFCEDCRATLLKLLSDAGYPPKEHLVVTEESEAADKYLRSNLLGPQRH
jgi:hypothetical protein